MKERREATTPGSDTRYTYAVGRIKALEARLVSPAEMERLLEEETQADAVRALGEFSDYAEIVAAGEKDPEEILEEQLRHAYDVVSELSLGSNAIKTLRLKYDFHNLKVLLKAKLLGIEPEGFSNVGFLSTEQVTRLLDEKTLEGDVDPFAAEAILAAISAVDESASLEGIETALDRFYYGLFLKNLGVNPFLEEYARRTIDLINLRTFWRVQVMEWPEERLAESLLSGGTIEKTFFTTNFATPIADLLARLPDDAYRRILREALTAYQSKKDLSALDRLADDFLIQRLRKGKLYCFGLEPLVGYIAAKENEVMRLRVILYGKEKSLPADSLRELLRSSYA